MASIRMPNRAWRPILRLRYAPLRMVVALFVKTLGWSARILPHPDGWGKIGDMDGKKIFSWKEVYRDYLALAWMAGAILLVDQITKAIVRGNLELGEMWAPWTWLEPYARIVHWKNTGAAFGIFQGFGDVFTVLAFVVSGAILYYFPQVPREDWILRLAMSLQFSGAVGNLIDRLTIGWVTDFISVGSFPVFNVADACISVGTAVLVLGMWWKDRRQKLETETSPDPISEQVE